MHRGAFFLGDILVQEFFFRSRLNRFYTNNHNSLEDVIFIVTIFSCLDYQPQFFVMGFRWGGVPGQRGGFGHVQVVHALLHRLARPVYPVPGHSDGDRAVSGLGGFVRPPPRRDAGD